MQKNKTFADGINQALLKCMSKDKNIICYGLGVGDPKEIFGTTKNLIKKFGNKRVFDIPTSENALTGVAIGAAINGCKVVMTHQRLDFALLSLDQLINNAAKWHYTFNGRFKVPITIRLIIGKGWGQGPTHSQALHSIFAHIPGLKVMMPFFPNDAKNLLIQAINDPNPVIFIEHRWLHNQLGTINKTRKVPSIEKIKNGNDITIISSSVMTKEALEIFNILKKNKISADLLNINIIKPLEEKKILNSVNKTGRVLVLDFGPSFLSVASEIIAIITNKSFKYLKYPPKNIALPNFPVPTSYGMTKKFYPGIHQILKECEKIMNKKIKFEKKINQIKHDVPDEKFRGPF